MSDACTIRDMTSGDFPAVLAVAAGLDGVRMSAAEDQAWHDRFIRRNAGLCVVAEQAGAVVGFAYCGSDGRRATVYHLSVATAYQGRGVGSALLAELERRIQAAGVPRALLMVMTTNDRALEFYARHGWRVRDDLFLLSKDL
jgi:ribosomal protein S18 acetylase RimI-like enzyme